MMKFIAIVLTAFLERVKPVSTIANPSCMNITRKPATSSHARLSELSSGGDDAAVCACAERERKQHQRGERGCRQSELRSSRHHLVCPRYDRRGVLVRCRVTVCEPDQEQKCSDERREEHHVPEPAPHLLHRQAARMETCGAILRHDLRRIAQVLEHLGRARIAVARIALDRMQHDFLEMRIEVGLERGRRLRILGGLRLHHVVDVADPSTADAPVSIS